MTRVSIFTVATVVMVGFGALAPAMAADSPDPFKYISADSPGFDEYTALIERLDADGAEILIIERTFLRRLRLVVAIDGKLREVIISPNTGEIRRDIIIGDYDPATFNGRGRAPSWADNSDGNNGVGNGSGGGRTGNRGGGGSKSKGKRR